MNQGEDIAFFYPVTHPALQDKSHGRVDGIGFSKTPGSQFQAGYTKVSGGQALQVAVLDGFDFLELGRQSKS